MSCWHRVLQRTNPRFAEFQLRGASYYWKLGRKNHTGYKLERSCTQQKDLFVLEMKYWPLL